jgi:TonB family protein
MLAIGSALLALALQPAAPPPPPPPAPRPPTSWPSATLSNEDYPAAALRGEEEGRVRYRLAIGADGRVSNCTITASSGSAALDAATCRIMRARTRFTPARDAAGHPAPDSRAGQIVWVLQAEPEEPPPPPPPEPVTPYPGPPLPYAAPVPAPE